MRLPRSSGVLLHPTSLPGRRLGADAYAFVDWLADAGQSWWQMLPLGPPDRYGSPYKAKSAFAAWPGLLGEPRARGSDAMGGARLGPAFSSERVRAALKAADVRYERFPEEDALVARTADLLAEGKVVGWFQGRMEFGPRALGSRSILADPRDPGMQSRVNQMVKFRESFRPFAPAVLAAGPERVNDLLVLVVPDVAPLAVVVGSEGVELPAPAPSRPGDLLPHHPRAQLPVLLRQPGGPEVDRLHHVVVDGDEVHVVLERHRIPLGVAEINSALFPEPRQRGPASQE